MFTRVWCACGICDVTVNIASSAYFLAAENHYDAKAKIEDN